MSAEHRDQEGIVAVSPVTGCPYLIYRWDVAGDDGEIIAKQKRILYRGEIGVLADVDQLHEAARKAYRKVSDNGDRDE